MVTGVERVCWYEFVIYYLICLSILTNCTINFIVRNSLIQIKLVEVDWFMRCQLTFLKARAVNGGGRMAPSESWMLRMIASWSLKPGIV